MLSMSGVGFARFGTWMRAGASSITSRSPITITWSRPREDSAVLTKNKKAPNPKRIIAFAVVEGPEGTFTPTRLEIEHGEVTKEVQCAPSGPYRPQAYQYLAARVMEFYVQGTVNDAG